MNPPANGTTTHAPRVTRSRALWLHDLPVLALGLALSGCPNPNLKELNPCLVSGVIEDIAADGVDKVDVLFVIDNSHSMADLQAALEVQLPSLIQVLTSGKYDQDSVVEDFPPVTDLHLGVVSTDMGLIGVPDIPKCGTHELSRTQDPRGDDGRLIYQTRQPRDGCNATYDARFLRFRAGDDPGHAATHFACLAMLGTDGCGFEQQLEAPLKALAYPDLRADVLGDAPNFASEAPDNPEEVAFLGPTQSEWGHGWNPHTGEHGTRGNAGFLRPDSLLAIIQVTDEEDCSAWKLDHFHHPNNIQGRTDIHPAPDHPHRTELNLRCFYNKQNLYPIKRYVNGIKALRPESEDFVVYAAIVGVDQRLVAQQPDDWRDAAAREAWYEMVLDDESMVEVVDPDTGHDDIPLNLKWSCRTIADLGGGAQGVAYPPRRIVETVRGFGPNGIVQSICQEDFGPALHQITRVISDALGEVCLEREIPPTAEGVVNCELVWELLPHSAKQENSQLITSCSEADYLEPPSDRPHINPDTGREVCVVRQLAVDRGVDPPLVIQPDNAQGWYYDDFSDRVREACPEGRAKARAAFSQGISPSPGVNVRLECLNEVQTLPDLQADRVSDGRKIGDSCQNDDGCAGAMVESQPLICHSENNRCVIGCEVSAHCPAGWVCDTRNLNQDPGFRPYCVNPTCGD